MDMLFICLICLVCSRSMPAPVGGSFNALVISVCMCAVGAKISVKCHFVIDAGILASMAVDSGPSYLSECPREEGRHSLLCRAR